MNAEQTRAEEARSLALREFIWSVKTQRLCTAAVRKHANPALSKEEAEKTSKAEAIEYIARAEKWASEQISRAIERGEMTEDEAKEARQELAEIVEETKRQAESLAE